MPRQTLLQFQTVPPVANNLRSTEGDRELHTNPERELPSEIWFLIFAQLRGHTLALKTCRLVCRYWAEVGLRPLFKVAYLDSSPPSWSRLVALCKSPFAKHVQVIQWNPLAIYRDCFYGNSWRSSYANLLKGACHSVCVELYEACYQMYLLEEERGCVGGPEAKALTDAIHHLHNCRELILSDTHDLETTCMDGVTGTRWQNDSAKWKTLAMWGRSPRLGEVYSSQRRGILQTTAYVLDLPKHAKSIECLSIDMWENHYSDVLMSYSSPPMSGSAIQQVHMSLKSCEVGDEWVHEYAGYSKIQLGIYHPFVPYLLDAKEVILDSMYSDPGVDFVRGVELLRLGEDHPDHVEYEDASAEPIEIATKFSDIEERLEYPSVLAPPMQSVYYAEVGFRYTLWQSDLRSITLNNVVINIGCLIFWLIDLTRLGTRSFKLNLANQVVLYGMDKEAILSTLAALNVTISCDPLTTFHHDVPSKPGVGHDLFLSSKYYYPRLKDDLVLEPWPFQALDAVDYEEATFFQDSDEHTVPLDGSAMTVKFLDLPQAYKEIYARNIAECRAAETARGFLYGYTKFTWTDRNRITHSDLIFKWVEESTILSQTSPDALNFRGIMQLQMNLRPRHAEYY